MSLPPLEKKAATQDRTDKESIGGEEKNGSLDEKVDGDEASGAPEFIRIPWQYKWIALLFTACLPLGQNWTDASMGPLKNTLRNELGINNTQFGVIGSAGSIVNSIWPILGGMCLDWYGPSVVTLFCTSSIFIGSIIAALGTNLVMWRMLVAGHVIMGFGTAVLDSAQHKLFYHYFGAGGLAMAFGLESAVSKTIGLVAGMTSIPIKEATGWFGYCFWIPVGFCGFSLLANIVYVIFNAQILPPEMRLTSNRAAAMAAGKPNKKKFSIDALRMLPWAFWMLPATQLLQSGAAGGFSQSSADIIRMKGFSESVAAFQSSAADILPIVLVPLIGIAVDRWGHRFHLTAIAPLLWILSCSLIGFSSVHPLVPVVFSSFASTINSFPFQVTIPLLVADQGKLGTAFGVWRAFNNSGSTIIDIVFGVLQDGTDGMAYDKVLYLAIGLKAWAFFLGCFYVFADHKWLGRGMTMSEKKRVDLEESIVDRDADPLTARPVKRWVTRTALGLLCSIVITAWVIFIKYLL